MGECEAALHDLASRLRKVDPDLRGKHVLERRLACELTDLGESFRGELGDDGLSGIERGTANDAQITLRVSSDDLLRLVNGELGFAHAWASGRLRVDASITDLIRLRTLI